MAIPDREKFFEDMFIPFDRIHECDGRTDRQTDGRTDGRHTTAYAALRIASRGGIQSNVRLRFRPCGVKIFNTPRCSEIATEVDETWQV